MERRQATVLIKCAVYENPGAGRDFPPLLVDVQADLLTDLESRIVIPLIGVDSFGRPISRLHPQFVVNATHYVLATQLIAADRRRDLGQEIASLRDSRDAIIAAIDVLLSGL